jgi:hypothetical protein
MITGQFRSHPIAALLAIACCAFIAVPALATVNLNPGFELGTGTDADNWMQFAGGGGPATAAERVSAEPASGNWHMMLRLGGTEPSGSFAEAQNLTPLSSIIPGELYDFSVDAKRVGPLGVSVVAFLEVQWLDSDGSHGGGVKGSSGLQAIGGALTETYQSFGFSGITAAPDSDAALIKLLVQGGALEGASAIVYFDNAALVVPEPASFGLLLAGAILSLRRRRAA